MSTLEALALVLAAFAGATAQSATGFGVVLPLAPVLLAVQEPADAVLTTALAGLTHNLLVLAGRRDRPQVLARDARLLVATALPGLLAGAALVAELDKPVLQVVLGAAVLAAVAVRLHERAPAALAGTPAGVLAGALSGTLTTTIGVNGPPLVIWLRARAQSQLELRDTLAAVFAVLNVVALLALVLGPAHGAADAGIYGVVALGLLAGHAAGSALGRRAGDHALTTATGVLLAAVGIASLVAGIV